MRPPVAALWVGKMLGVPATVFEKLILGLVRVFFNYGFLVKSLEGGFLSEVVGRWNPKEL